MISNEIEKVSRKFLQSNINPLGSDHLTLDAWLYIEVDAVQAIGQGMVDRYKK